jgi:hypothetical protein
MANFEDNDLFNGALGNLNQLGPSDFVPFIGGGREMGRAAQSFQEAGQADNPISALLRGAEGAGSTALGLADFVTPMIPLAGTVKGISKLAGPSKIRQIEKVMRDQIAGTPSGGLAKIDPRPTGQEVQLANRNLNAQATIENNRELFLGNLKDIGIDTDKLNLLKRSDTDAVINPRLFDEVSELTFERTLLEDMITNNKNLKIGDVFELRTNLVGMRPTLIKINNDIDLAKAKRGVRTQQELIDEIKEKESVFAEFFQRMLAK